MTEQNWDDSAKKFVEIDSISIVDIQEFRLEKMVQIIKLLPENGDAIQYKDLEIACTAKHISSATLIKYLRILEKNKVVLRDPDTTTWPVRVFYSRQTLDEDLFCPACGNLTLYK